MPYKNDKTWARFWRNECGKETDDRYNREKRIKPHKCNRTSCLLHRQNKCQYLLVVRLFRINKCLLLLFIIGKFVANFLLYTYCQCLAIEWCCIERHWDRDMVIAHIYTPIRHTSCQLEFVFAVLWFWTLYSVYGGIKLFVWLSRI